jgi:hypothetical protein
LDTKLDTDEIFGSCTQALALESDMWTYNAVRKKPYYMNA